MARRKRRFFRKTTSPDMGWIVGTAGPTNMNYPAGDPDANSALISLFDFADIDPEALTGRIEQDKSDWFIKRVILHIKAVAVCDGLATYDNTRFFEWGCGVMGNANADEVTTANYPVWSPETYNLWARQFQTGVMPAYMPAVVPYGVGNPANELGIATTDAASTTANTPAGWLMPAPFWGPAMQTYDFTVSNAGLRNNQGFFVMYAQVQDGPSNGFNWDEGDQLLVNTHYQVLLQKRRP